MRQLMGADYEKFRTASEEVAEAAARYGLTEHERVAVWAYTTNEGEFRGQALNRELWRGGRGSIPPAKYHTMSLTLRDALRKVPTRRERGMVRRDMALLEEGQLDPYIKDSIVTEVGFTSTAASEKGRVAGNVRFAIEGRGKFIGDLSRHKDEKEVLFGAGTRFRVKNRWEEGGIVRVELEEIDDA